MLTDSQISQFDHDGFLNGGRILDDQQIEDLKNELDELLARGPDSFAGKDPRPVLFHNMTQERDPEKCVWQIVNIWEVCDSYKALIHHPFIVDAISRLTQAKELMVWHDQIQHKPAGYGGVTGWHQDAPLWPIIKPMTPVSAWVALDDALQENGCMWMVPGSHKWGNQIEFLRTQSDLKEVGEFGGIKGFEPPDDAEVTTVTPRPWPVKAGEVSFHHSLTWHGSPFNLSDMPRRAIAIHYMTGESRYVASGKHVMQEYVHIDDDELMRNAGAHFPLVYQDGEAVTV